MVVFSSFLRLLTLAEVAGVALTSQSRVELMQKLARDPTPYQSAVLQP